MKDLRCIIIPLSLLIFHALVQLSIVSCSGDFNWHAYLELNPSAAEDIVFNTHPIGQGKKIRSTFSITADEALRHYQSLQRRLPQYRIPKYPYAQPLAADWGTAVEKLKQYSTSREKIEATPSTLVLYHIEDVLLTDTSIEVVENNVKLFIMNMILESSTVNHSVRTGMDQAPWTIFYLFIVAETIFDTNPFTKLLPEQFSNVAVVRWQSDVITAPISPLIYHLEALWRLNEDHVMKNQINSLFNSFLFTGSIARGSFLQQEPSSVTWINAFYQLLHQSNTVALVSPIIQKLICSDNKDRRIQMHSYTFMIRSEQSVVQILLQILSKYQSSTTFTPFTQYFEENIVELMASAGWDISSILHNSRHMQSTINKKINLHDDATLCIPSAVNSSIDEYNPRAEEVIVQHWSGAALNEEGHIFSAGITASEGSFWPIFYNHTPHYLTPQVPETVIGGISNELHRDYLIQNTSVVSSLQKSAPKTDENVCFLVRTAISQDPSYVHIQSTPNMPEYNFLEVDLNGFIRSLMKQTDQHWLAFFIITDPSPFEERLQQILSTFQDSRLIYIEIPSKYRPQFDPVDAGYTATDYAMAVLKARDDCKWISATNGDNAYGVDVVRRVIQEHHHDMLLLPLDSRNFLHQGTNAHLDRTFEMKCLGLQAMIAINGFAYTVQPVPIVGRVDLAAVFFDRLKLASEGVDFGNFTNVKKFVCIGCQDGYFTQFLVRARGWTYKRLPIDGLKSIVFHGPSPTLCIASGNVWLHHLSVNRNGCLTHKMVHHIRHQDAQLRIQKGVPTVFDWQHYLSSSSSRLCLRLSKHGQRVQDIADRDISSASGGQSSENATTLPVDFDWQDYLELNPSLAGLGLDNEAAAKEHYLNIGKKNGFLIRRPCDWEAYLLQNHDLAGEGITDIIAAQKHYESEGKYQGRDCRRLRSPNPYFNWREYLELNPAIVRKGVRTEAHAIRHYNSNYSPARRYNRTEPLHPTQWTAAIKKMKLHFAKTSTTFKALVIYHIEDISNNDNSIDLVLNNVKLFIAAIHRDASVESKQPFYLFNVMSWDENPVMQILPQVMSHVAVVNWELASSAIYSHMRCLQMLQDVFHLVDGVKAPFDTVFFLGSNIRAPLIYPSHQQWILAFHRLLYQQDQFIEGEVGIVGPAASCEGGLHILDYAFAIKMSAVTIILKEVDTYYSIDPFISFDAYMKHRITTALIKAGYNVVSMLHLSRGLLNNITGIITEQYCQMQLKTPFNAEEMKNWCQIHPKEVLLMHWSGEAPDARGFLCDKTLEMTSYTVKIIQQLSMKQHTEEISQLLQLHLPEPLHGGLLLETFDMYADEIHSNITNAIESVPSFLNMSTAQDDICFIAVVEPSSLLNHPRRLWEGYEYLDSNIKDFIESLLRQSLPHWRVYLFLRFDHQIYLQQLQAFIQDYHDYRLQLLYNNDKGKEGMELEWLWNIALSNQLSSTCRFVSFTSTKNHYGTAVVETILSFYQQKQQLYELTVHDSYQQQYKEVSLVDIILMPTESSHYIQQESKLRHEKDSYEMRCRGLRAMLQIKRVGYIIQPQPHYNQLLLPSIFFSISKLQNTTSSTVSEIISKLEVIQKPLDCKDCLTSLFIKYLIRSQHWTYHRAAYAGLKTTIYESSSPTLCIAAGNVWIDLPSSEANGCLSRISIKQMQFDMKNNIYDWHHFHAAKEWCLRYSMARYNKLQQMK